MGASMDGMDSLSRLGLGRSLSEGHDGSALYQEHVRYGGVCVWVSGGGWSMYCMSRNRGYCPFANVRPSPSPPDGFTT